MREVRTERDQNCRGLGRDGGRSQGTVQRRDFSPAWLLHQNIIGASDYADAEVEIVTSEFALFRTGWLRCQVAPDTFQVSTTEPEEFERLRDAAVGVLNTLSHTPVAALGINRELHFSTQDRDQYRAGRVSPAV